jgi:hypothetical protein
MLRYAIRRSRGSRALILRVAVGIRRPGTDEIGAHRAAANQRQDHGDVCDAPD